MCVYLHDQIRVMSMKKIPEDKILLLSMYIVICIKQNLLYKIRSVWIFQRICHMKTFKARCIFVGKMIDIHLVHFTTACKSDKPTNLRK